MPYQYHRTIDNKYKIFVHETTAIDKYGNGALYGISIEIDKNIHKYILIYLSGYQKFSKTAICLVSSNILICALDRVQCTLTTCI